MVATPAGTPLGFVEKLADGGWGITPSEDGLVRVTEIARTLRDAKAYLVNRLTREVTVTVNGESKHLRMVGDRDFFPKPAWTGAPGTSMDTTLDTYDLELWDSNHGLLPGEKVSMELQSEAGDRFVSVLEGTVTTVAEQKITISGTDVFKSRGTRES